MKKCKKTLRVEQHKINKNSDAYKIIDELSWKSKNVYNYVNYAVRQKFIETSKEKEAGLREQAIMMSVGEMIKICKNEPYGRELKSDIKTGVCRHIDQNWRSYFASIKDWAGNKEKYNGKPNMPGYLNKNNGRCLVYVHNRSIKIKDGDIVFSRGDLLKLNGLYKTHIPEGAKIESARFVPKQSKNKKYTQVPDFYNLEIIYDVEVPKKPKKTNGRVAAIDLGVNNLMTVVTNCGVNPIVINGKPLKSINQYYNKRIAEMRSELELRNGKKTSNELRRFTNKRNAKVDYYIHCASKKVVEFCVENNIQTLICGYNSEWKKECDFDNSHSINPETGKEYVTKTKENLRLTQNFVQIPYLSLVEKLTYKCESAGIEFEKETEEYTSGTSFLDGEDASKENYNKSRRIKRGLFQSNDGTEINADVNGAYQIMRKKMPKAFKNVYDLKSLGLHPTIINI